MQPYSLGCREFEWNVVNIQLMAGVAPNVTAGYSDTNPHENKSMGAFV